MQCGQAPGEWRLLGWLEREGFAYDYYAEAQLHDGTLQLDAYRVLSSWCSSRILDARDVLSVKPGSSNAAAA